MRRQHSVQIPNGRRRSTAVAFLVSGAVLLCAGSALATEGGDPNDYSFVTNSATPARWNACDYIDWKVTLDGAPRDGFNTVVEAVRRVEAATGLRFRYGGVSSFIPTSARPTEAGIDLSIAWVEEAHTDLVARYTGLGGGRWDRAVDAEGRPVWQMLSGYAVMESSSFRDHETDPGLFLPGDPTLMPDVVGQEMDRQLHLTLHEVGHAIGLNHAAGTGQVMSHRGDPLTEWGPGDLSGLRHLGAGVGCTARTQQDARAGSLPIPLPGPDLLPSEIDFGSGDEPPHRFNDVRNNVHADSIDKVAAAGIAAGYPDGSFRPGAQVTRGQMATFLTRALGLEPVEGSRFPDAVGDAHEASINAVAAAGITAGQADGRFSPSQPVTREQMATFLVRGFDLPAAEPGRFTDTSGSVHRSAIDAVAAAGISQGDGRGAFDPAAVVTRGQLATFLSRALHL